MKMRKKSVSAIVATVLILLITVSVIVIVSTLIVPMIRNMLQGGTACLAMQSISVDAESDYTCYDSATGVASVMVSRGVSSDNRDEAKLAGLIISIGAGETRRAYRVSEDSSLVLALDFDEGYGTTAYDLSGNAHHGTIHDAEWVTMGCHSGSCLRFNGYSSYVGLGHISELDNADELTIEAWVKGKKEDQAEGNYSRIVDKLDTQEKSGWSINIIEKQKDDGGKIQFQIGIGSNIISVSSEELSGNDWQHVAAVLDSESVKLCIDGNCGYSTSLNGNMRPNTNPVRIGGNFDGNVWHYFNGTIDEVRIYTRALSEREIEQHAKSTSKEKEIFAKLPGENEARTYKFNIGKDLDEVTVEIAPVVKIGNREVTCEARGSVALPSCS